MAQLLSGSMQQIL